MNQAQRDLIPDRLLKPDQKAGCQHLVTWLAARGWHMSLFDLEQERIRRGLRVTRRPEGVPHA